MRRKALVTHVISRQPGPVRHEASSGYRDGRNLLVLGGWDLVADLRSGLFHAADWVREYAGTAANSGDNSQAPVVVDSVAANHRRDLDGDQFCFGAPGVCRRTKHRALRGARSGDGSDDRECGAFAGPQVADHFGCPDQGPKFGCRVVRRDVI